jgi:aquaporin Z
MVYNTGHISGGHLNPSVTLSLLFAGKMEIFHASCYIFVQIAAAMCSSWTAHGVLGPKAAYPSPGDGFSDGTAFSVEVLYNTLLVLVVLHTACTKKTEGNTYYGMAIGFTVAAGSIVCGPISGGALNPAIGFMGCGAGKWNLLGIYCPSGIVAALLGLVLYRISAPKEEVEQGVDTSLCYMSCHWLPKCMGTTALIYNNELIGTFYLCLSVTLSVGLAGAGYLSGSAAALAIGATLMVCVYMGGYISGGHYNPAVTLAIMLCDRDDVGEYYWASTRVQRSIFYLPRPESANGAPFGYFFYFVVQFAGAFLAAAFGHLILGVDAGYPVQGQYGTKEYSAFTCIIAEAIGTAALVFSVLNAAVSKDVLPNNYFGFVIGMTVFVSASTLGNISGGAFNPAVGLGLAGALGGGAGDASHCWIYFVGPTLGSLIAVACYRCVEVRPLYVEDIYGERVSYGTMPRSSVGEMEQNNPLFREES